MCTTLKGLHNLDLQYYGSGFISKQLEMTIFLWLITFKRKSLLLVNLIALTI